VPGSGSTFTMIPRLAEELREAGVGVDLLSVDEDPGAPRDETPEGFPVRRFQKGSLGAAIGRSAAFEAAIDDAARHADLIHVHGMWRRSLIAALRAARRHRVRAVLSPMGLFAPEALKISRRRKLAYWHLLQKPALAGLACHHATSLAEHDHMRAFGIRAPIAVIPPGIDIPVAAPPAVSPDPARTLLCIGRISTIKNLRSLVLAWRSIQDSFPDARLRLVGPDDRGHAAQIAQVAEEVGARRVSIEPGAWGEARYDAFAAAHAVILPSLSESFGLVAAEGLAMARPVVATTGTPWRIVRDEECGWWVEPTPEAIARALREALSLPPDALAAMGARGRDLALRELGWDTATPRFVALYEWILGGGQPPEFVSL